MIRIAHRGKIMKENTIEGVLEISGLADIVEIDVRFSTDRRVVLCHDREKRNDGSNVTLQHLLTRVDPTQPLMLDVKAFGMTCAKELARSVASIVLKFPHTFHLCSFNEYCVDELLSIRDETESTWQVGVISSGIPLGMFAHLNVDFVSLDYSIVCEDLVHRLKENSVLIYAWVVNDDSMQRMMSLYGVDGIVLDY